jgi:hypothetical protein
MEFSFHKAILQQLHVNSFLISADIHCTDLNGYMGIGIYMFVSSEEVLFFFYK